MAPLLLSIHWHAAHAASSGVCARVHACVQTCAEIANVVTFAHTHGGRLKEACMLSPKVLSSQYPSATLACPKKRLKLALSDKLFGGVVNVKTAFQFVAHCWLIQPNRILGFYQGFLLRKKP